MIKFLLNYNHSKATGKSINFCIKCLLLPIDVISQLHLHHNRFLTHRRVCDKELLGYCTFWIRRHIGGTQWVDCYLQVFHHCALKGYLVDIAVSFVHEACCYFCCPSSLTFSLHPNLYMVILIGFEFKGILVLGRRIIKTKTLVLRLMICWGFYWLWGLCWPST